MDKIEIIFKENDSTGHFIYNIADNISKGYKDLQNGQYVVYFECSKSDMNNLIKKGIECKKEYLHAKIKKCSKELFDLSSELIELAVKPLPEIAQQKVLNYMENYNEK